MTASPLGAVGGALSREVGGLPVGVWGLIAAGGLVLGRKFAGGDLFGGGGAPAPAGVPFIDPNSTGYTATGETATTTSPATVPQITDNAAWRRAAVDYLTARQIAYVDAERAIGRYLTGDVLTAADVATVNTAVRGIGSPPDAPPTPTPVTPATPPPGAPTGRQIKTTTVLAPYGLGENAKQIATRLRKAGTQTTTDGRPLTAAYLMRSNGLTGSTSRALRPGARIVY